MTPGRRQEHLDAEFLLLAYRHGFFPMAESRTGRISWFSPDPRAVIPLEDFRIPRSLKQILRANAFTTKVNTAFHDVILGCADREETWISDEIIDVYSELHAMGFAHSVETWREGSLVGGLYGVSLGRAFFGESMFSRESNASKVALVRLVEMLRFRDFLLLDAQFMTQHLHQFGALEMPRSRYLQLLAEAVSMPYALQSDF